MKRHVFVAAVIGAAALTATPVAAQSLTGTWEITTETQRGSQTQTLTLVQEGESLTGTVTLTMGGRRGGRGGGGGAGAMTIDISNGEVEGTGYRFTVTMERGGNSMSTTYSGSFEGDSIEGHMEGGRGGARQFTGKRAGGEDAPILAAA